MVTIDDFAKLELKVGTVVEAGEIEGSDKLLKLKVDFGILADSIPAISSESEKSPDEVEEPEGMDVAEDSNELRDPSAAPQDDSQEEDQPKNDIRQILSGIKQWYKPEDLVGKQFIFITNLAPRKMMGLESQGMIMAAEGEDRPIPLTVSEKVPNGAKIR